MKSLRGTPKAKVVIGLLVGIGLLFLVSRFVNLAFTFHVLLQNLATPRGLILALLSGIAFLSAFSIRGVRWKLFLNPICNVSTFTAIRSSSLASLSTFSYQSVAGKSQRPLMLKRITTIPISRSLPTVRYGQINGPVTRLLHHSYRASTRHTHGYQALVSIMHSCRLIRRADLLCRIGSLETRCGHYSPLQNNRNTP